MPDIEGKLLEAVKSAAKCSRLSCREALDLAARLGISPALIGRAADELGVKITGCQLGCFKREQ